MLTDRVRLRGVRYAGLAGSVLLALGAYLGGVFPTWQPDVTPASIWRGDHGPVILACWLVGTALLTGAWWWGHAIVTSTRWAYLTAGLWLVPLLAVPPLGSRDVYSYACQGWVFADGQDPYAAGVAELGCPWLDSVSPIWRDSPAPYGPLFVLLAGVAAAVGGTLAGTVAMLRLVALLGIVLTAACLPVLARRAGAPPARAAWLALASPLVGVHLLAGAHNDALMVGLMVAGLAVVATWPGRTGPLLAGGGLLGLAVAVKVTAVVVVPFAVLLAVRGGYRPAALAGAGVRVLAGGLAALLGVAAVSGLGWGWVDGLARSGDSEQWTSPPTAVGLTVGYLARPFGADWDAVPAVRAVAVVALAVLLVALWWRAVRRRTPLLGAGLALAATVAFAPVFHPWYAYWPLAVLAVTMLPARWLLAPVSTIAFLTLPDGTNLARFSKFPGAVAITAMAAVAVIVVARRALATRS
ncbi:polyprenol phosphomannose-dependent alpha 1,6 mannosyltransferase MptB [Solwaraspora sp. WMMD1047]|uniref:polyprenol phosphomannose-dependent alpha 1,6 mannosyltransferase MptB n=1 Tax=Solwaraspora sp. WMMD1047 TaxID=3016102 RepID=UPI002416923C|nr:polyprenol phosphomannose-dependent alpha 1,6 mannosyltransferase MptB [Solwaraspora sp. WMMD1047]MDG4832322.1 polyprenol phosphomannose-dependent alpha 1,6 mannosyltransferase MptB [Solwaraspora sp. WMMD1047]